MHWWYDGWSWWGWLLMSVGMVAFWGLVAWVVVTLVRSPGSPAASPRPSAQQLLAERFAKGEIDEDEYRARLEALRSGPRVGARR